MKEYVLIIPQEEGAILGKIRCMPDLLVAQDMHLYVRGINEETISDKCIQQLPVLQTYLLDEEERLFPLNGSTPVAKLPLLSWQPISKFVSIALPVSALPAKLSNKLLIRLKPTENRSEGCALMTTLATWKLYADTAPAIRLEHLQFAAAANGNVLIMGTPLPPLPGREFYQQHNILLPAGYAFEVPVVATVLQQKLNTNNDSVLLIETSGEWHSIPLSFFVQATRAAVRLTHINSTR